MCVCVCVSASVKQKVNEMLVTGRRIGGEGSLLLLHLLLTWADR